MEDRAPSIVNRPPSIFSGVAVLALQGDFEAHRKKLEECLEHYAYRYLIWLDRLEDLGRTRKRTS